MTRSPLLGCLLLLSACAGTPPGSTDDTVGGDPSDSDSLDDTPATGGPDIAVIATDQEISLLDLDSSETSKVHDEPYGSPVRLSPDATRVAWQHSDIWIGEADGTTLTSFPYYDLVDFRDDDSVIFTGLVINTEGYMAALLDPENIGYSAILFQEDNYGVHDYASRFAMSDGRFVFMSSDGDASDLVVLDTFSLAVKREATDPELGVCKPVWLLGGDEVACARGNTLVLADARLADARTVSLSVSIDGYTLVPVGAHSVLAGSTILDERGAVCKADTPEQAGDPCIVEIDVETGSAVRRPLLESQNADLTKMVSSEDGPTILYVAGSALLRARPSGGGAMTILDGVEIRDLDW